MPGLASRWRNASAVKVGMATVRVDLAVLGWSAGRLLILAADDRAGPAD